MKKLSTPAIVVISAVLAGCATTDDNLPRFGTMLRDTTGQNARACIRLRDIDGSGVLDDGVIMIVAGRKYYLATIRPGCGYIARSVRIGFDSGSIDICGGGMGYIYTRDKRCNIRDLYKFDNREQAFEAYNTVQAKREELREKAEAEVKQK